MNSTTRITATIDAVTPARIESAPRSGPTVDSSMTLRSIASAPERSAIASSFADSTVKLPKIDARPPRIGWLMLGAEMTWLSRMMANGLPTFSCVTRAKRRPPWPSKVIATCGWLVCWSNSCVASTSCSPEMMTGRFTAMKGMPDGLVG